MIKAKKRLIIILSILAVIVIGIIIMINNINKSFEVYNNFDFGSLDLSSVDNGTYTGSEDGGIVKATVEVTIKDHTITNVKILAHDNGKGKPAEVIVNDIVEKNSLEVDTVSGATHSSNVIRMAVYNALRK